MPKANGGIRYFNSFIQMLYLLRCFHLPFSNGSQIQRKEGDYAHLIQSIIPLHFLEEVMQEVFSFSQYLRAKSMLSKFAIALPLR